MILDRKLRIQNLRSDSSLFLLLLPIKLLGSSATAIFDWLIICGKIDYICVKNLM